MNEHILGIIKKYKKPLLIICFFFGYTMFWWWFFGEKDIAIKEAEVEQSSDIVVEEKDEETDIVNNNEEQFTEFGNFWLHINTEDVNIKAPIIDGVTDEKLAMGIGHHKTTAFPNKERGNVVLSGHRWKFGKNPAYKVFEDIDELKIGDNVTVHYRGEDFVYEIIEKKTVDDKAIDTLEQTDEAILTFYTCTPKYTSLKRLVYSAKLVDIFYKTHYDEEVE